MKTYLGLIVLTIFSIALCAFSATAETVILPGKIGSYGSYYDTSSEEVFTASVIRVHEICYSSSLHYCLALEVRRAGEQQTDIVYLGPKAGLDSDLTALEGQDVCVVASHVKVQGKTIFIGRTVLQGSEEYVLRTADGRHFAPGMRIDDTRDGSVCAIAEADIAPR